MDCLHTKDALVVVFVLPVGETEILDNRVQYPDRRLKGLDGAIVVAFTGFSSRERSSNLWI